MPDFPPEWRLLLKLLASSANGCTASLLSSHSFPSWLIAGLVDAGLVTATTEHILTGQRAVDMTRFKITDRGLVMLEH